MSFETEKERKENSKPGGTITELEMMEITEIEIARKEGKYTDSRHGRMKQEAGDDNDINERNGDSR